MRHRSRKVGSALAGALLLVSLVASACTGGKESTSSLPEVKADPRVDKSRLAKELNVYNWTEYLPQEVLDQFTKLYGVKINYDTYSSNEEMHNKLKAGGSGYDVVFPSDYAIRGLMRDGLLQPIDLKNLPNLGNVEARFRGLPFDPNNEFSIPYMWGTTGIVVNTSKLKGEITGWGDLWKPELKGQLVVVDDPREVIGFALRTRGNSPNTKDRSQLEDAKLKLKELKGNIKAFNSDSPKEMLLGGEVVAGVVWSGEAAKIIEQDHNFKYIIPSEGITIWMDNMAIPKGARSKYTAEVFINYLLEPSVSAQVSMEHLYGNPNREAQKLLPAFHRENPALILSEEVFKKAQWIEDLGEDGNQLYDRIWTELKG